MIGSRLLTAASGGGDIYIGEQEFPDVGTYAWDVPLSVRYLHACAIGAGGPYGSQTIDGGGGGGLAWANDIEVTPGETLIIQVGRIAADDARHSGIFRLADPEDIESAKTWLIKGEGARNYSGGGYSFGPGVGSSGGGQGGSGSLGRNVNVNGNFAATYFGSGGGAGGYMGNGGSGSGGAPEADSGGASAGTQFNTTSGVSTGATPGGAGGGVGVRGRGTTASGIIYNDGDSVRNGNPGSGGNGANYGGGDSYPGGKGGDGAVRIIWGIKYSYPDNADVETEE